MFFSKNSLIHDFLRKYNDLNLFNDIKVACDLILANIGIKGDSYLLPGGLGLSLLDANKANFESLHDLPFIEYDFSNLQSIELSCLNKQKVVSIILPKGNSIPFGAFDGFNLKKFNSRNSTSIDFKSLGNLQLENLELPGTKLNDLGFCYSMPLKEVNISNTNVEDLGPIYGKAISRLNILKTRVKDLSPLRDMPIEVLNLSGTDVFDLEPAVTAGTLKCLEIRATQVNDLSVLADCPIQTLILPGSNVNSIECLAYLPIENLNIIGLKLDSLHVLKSLPLKELSVSPELLYKDDFGVLKELKIIKLRGPGDYKDQTPEEFFFKYEANKDDE